MARRGINKVILLGNLGADPECRTFQNGDMVANFSLATSETWQDKNTGDQREKTEWHRCAAFRSLAGVIQQYVKKGDKLYIEGRLQTRKWQDQNGQERYTTEIIVDEMQMLTPKGSSSDYDGIQQNRSNSSGYGNNQSDSNNYGNYQSSNSGGSFSPGGKPAQPQSNTSYGPDSNMGGGSNFSDSDIPF